MSSLSIVHCTLYLYLPLKVIRISISRMEKDVIALKLDDFMRMPY